MILSICIKTFFKSFLYFLNENKHFRFLKGKMFGEAIRKFNKDYSNLVKSDLLGQERLICVSKALRSCGAAECASACLLGPAGALVRIVGTA